MPAALSLSYMVHYFCLVQILLTLPATGPRFAMLPAEVRAVFSGLAAFSNCLSTIRSLDYLA